MLESRGVDEIRLLTKREGELWMRYVELDRRAKMAARMEPKGSEILEDARKRARWAHRSHQRCLEEILEMLRDRLCEEVPRAMETAS